MGHRLLINIRGTNGSGKTTLIKSLMEEGSEKIFINNSPKGILINKYPIVILGDYDLNKKMGGADLLKNQGEYFKILKHLAENYPNHHIIMEGLLISTVFSTYNDWFKFFKLKYQLLPIIITLSPPSNICLKRVKERNGNPDFNGKNVIDKHKQIYKNHLKFKAENWDCILYDNTNHTPEQSKQQLLEIIKFYAKE